MSSTKPAFLSPPPPLLSSHPRASSAAGLVSGLMPLPPGTSSLRSRSVSPPGPSLDPYTAAVAAAVRQRPRPDDRISRNNNNGNKNIIKNSGNRHHLAFAGYPVDTAPASAPYHIPSVHDTTINPSHNHVVSRGRNPLRSHQAPPPSGHRRARSSTAPEPTDQRLVGGHDSGSDAVALQLSLSRSPHQGLHTPMTLIRAQSAEPPLGCPRRSHHYAPPAPLAYAAPRLMPEAVSPIVDPALLSTEDVSISPGVSPRGSPSRRFFSPGDFMPTGAAPVSASFISPVAGDDWRPPSAFGGCPSSDLHSTSDRPSTYYSGFDSPTTDNLPDHTRFHDYRPVSNYPPTASCRRPLSEDAPIPLSTLYDPPAPLSSHWPVDTMPRPSVEPAPRPTQPPTSMPGPHARPAPATDTPAPPTARPMRIDRMQQTEIPNKLLSKLMFSVGSYQRPQPRKAPLHWFDGPEGQISSDDEDYTSMGDDGFGHSNSVSGQLPYLPSLPQHSRASTQSSSFLSDWTSTADGASSRMVATDDYPRNDFSDYPGTVDKPIRKHSLCRSIHSRDTAGSTSSSIRSSRSKCISKRSSRKHLQESNLNQDSVLCLSSSEDEYECDNEQDQKQRLRRRSKYERSRRSLNDSDHRPSRTPSTSGSCRSSVASAVHSLPPSVIIDHSNPKHGYTSSRSSSLRHSLPAWNTSSATVEGPTEEPRQSVEGDDDISPMTPNPPSRARLLSSGLKVASSSSASGRRSRIVSVTQQEQALLELVRRNGGQLPASLIGLGGGANDGQWVASDSLREAAASLPASDDKATADARRSLGVVLALNPGTSPKLDLDQAAFGSSLGLDLQGIITPSQTSPKSLKTEIGAASRASRAARGSGRGGSADLAAEAETEADVEADGADHTDSEDDDNDNDGCNHSSENNNSKVDKLDNRDNRKVSAANTNANVDRWVSFPVADSGVGIVHDNDARCTDVAQHVARPNPDAAVEQCCSDSDQRLPAGSLDADTGVVVPTRKQTTPAAIGEPDWLAAVRTTSSTRHAPHVPLQATPVTPPITPHIAPDDSTPVQPYASVGCPPKPFSHEDAPSGSSSRRPHARYNLALQPLDSPSLALPTKPLRRLDQSAFLGVSAMSNLSVEGEAGDRSGGHRTDPDRSASVSESSRTARSSPGGAGGMASSAAGRAQTLMGPC